MARRSFKNLNKTEKNLMVSGLITDLALKKGVRIRRKNALKLLRLPEKERKEQIKKIKRRKR